MTEVEANPCWGRQSPEATPSTSATSGVGIPHVVTVVEAPACHLCEQAKTTLADLAQSFPIAVQVVSISSERGRALMGHHRAPMSPLVLLDGQYFSSGRLPRRKLERRLAQQHRGQTHV